MLALVLALGACGQTAATPDAETPPADSTDNGDTTVTDDAPDATTDIKTNDSTDKADTKADGDTGPTQCTTATDCVGSPDPCHVWVCSNGQCDGSSKAAAAGTACDDGKACSVGDKCDAVGVCQAGTDPNPQKDPKTGLLNSCLQCKCTNNADGTCANVSTDIGAKCDDSNACSKNDSCQAGGVCLGAVDPPPAATSTCYSNVCDPATGIFKPQINAANAGLACDDNNACTQNETCNGAECNGGTAVSCTSGSPCMVAACDTKLGCQTTPLPLTTGVTVACDDKDACTDNDSCTKTGTCKGTSVTLGLTTLPCQVVSCDSATGQLTYAAAANGVSCDDGDPCSKGDACSNQTCKGSTLICNDGNPCTDDKCDPLKCTGTACGQCVAPVKVDGATCDDGNKCTTGDTCTLGKCSGLPTDCDDKNSCTNDSCQQASGCLHTPVVTAVACDDGDSCTTVDKCVGTTCKGTAKDCTDTDPCTSDSCDSTAPAASNCSHLKFNGPCDDGNNCTNFDLCVDGTCVGTKVDCNDGNPCTNDLCDSVKKCQHIPLPGGTVCDDGLACTQNDYCDAGKCTQLPADNKCSACNADSDCAKFNDQNMCNGTIKCIASYKGKVCDTDPATVVKCDGSKDSSCAKNTCNPDNGICAIVKFNAGTFCSGDKCLDNAQCDGLGTCKGITKNCDDNNACTTDSCDSTLGCKHASVTDGSACDDGSKCTPKDSCVAGTCVGNTNTCACTNSLQCAGLDDGNLCNGILTCQQSLCKPDPSTVITCSLLSNPCQDNVCTPATGQCAPVAKADNTKCDDSNLCTIGEVCLAAVCTSTTATNCNDNNPCTQDFCDTAFGCGNAPVALGSSCNDGNDCTTKDSCKTGACLGTVLNCDDGNPCTVDTCAKVGGCSHALDNTLSCSDGDPCTKPDHCSDGVCVSTPMNCDDNNSCTIDACDGNGGCKNVVYPGKDCDDGNPCTIQDVCVNDKCIGKPKSCDDGNACTNDICTAGTCIFAAATGQPCNDSNECTGPDLCDSNGQCQGNTKDCSTGTVCRTLLTCSPVTGCVTVQNDGANCDDGDACTGTPPLMTDKCQGGGCSGPTINCNDNNICTNDKCDSKLGCLITPVSCDDGNSCTIDTCDQVQGCLHETVNGGFCDDGNACTQNTTCDTGKCTGGTAVVCDDKNDCTGDTCDKVKGCAFATLPDGSTCTDGNLCTKDGCVSGACVGVALNCDDGNGCTLDECNAISGCVHTPMAEMSACDDGESCTINTVCQGGACGGGSLDVKDCPGFCNPATAKADCGWMDSDNNACDGTFRCTNITVLNKYVCKWDPTVVVCDTTSDQPCLHNTCDTGTGVCGMTQSSNGSLCEDGKGCTVSTTCNNGTCGGGTANDCGTVKDACNGATCVEDPNAVDGFRCVVLPLDATVACDADGNGCTANDHCSAGKCISGKAIDCSGVAAACQVGSCKSTGSNSFTCQTATAADNTACDDKQLCTVGDFCLKGACKSGTGSYDCSAQTGACALGTCDPKANAPFGACVPSPLNEGQPCDADKNGCTVGDRCTQGFCVPGIAPNCNASTSDCTVGACKAASNTTYTCVGAPKADKLPCEADQNGCTVGDSCLTGKCIPGPMLDCTALTSKDGCMVGTCQSLSNSQSTCLSVPAPVGSICDADGTGCTKGDACNVLGACTPGPNVDCSLTSDCASGACVSTSAQTYVCNGTAKPNGTVCNADNSGCTQGDTCQTGVCTAGTAVNCGASSVQCQSKTCSSTAQDAYVCQTGAVPDKTVCDADQNGCTVGDACTAGVCNKGNVQDCSSFTSACTAAACASTSSTAYVCNVTSMTSYPPLSPSVTCVTGATPDTCQAGYKCVAGICSPTVTLTCSDGNACTPFDYCSAGTCVGAPMNCDDGDMCTTDSCDPNTGGCVHAPITGCGVCLSEIGPVDANAAVRSRDASTVQWAYNSTNSDNEATWNASTWKDPAVSPSQTRLLLRKLLLATTGPTQLEFDVQVTGNNADCNVASVAVTVNGVNVQSVCDAAALTHVTVPLSAWMGAPVDIAIGTGPGSTKPTSTVTVALGAVKVKGMCSTTCVGVDFEPRDSGNAAYPYVLPQSWKASTTDVTYVSWATTTSAGHTGTSELVSTWTGTPTSGTPQVAKMTIPQLSVASGSTLSFAYKTSFADQTCGADDLSVRAVTSAGVTELLKQCTSSSGWVVKSYDLTPYVNTTLEIDIVVTTGSSSTAKGTVEIDDISITGDCSYLCFSDDFETGGLAKWTTASTDSGSKFKAFAANTTSYSSATTSAFAQYDTNSTNTKMVYMAGDISKGSFLELPVMGATLSAAMNAFTVTPPSDCATNSNDAIFWFRITEPSTSIVTTVAALVAGISTGTLEPLATNVCALPKTGWAGWSGTISTAATLDVVVPSFYVVKQAASTSGKIYIDDVQVICH